MTPKNLKELEICPDCNGKGEHPNEDFEYCIKYTKSIYFGYESCEEAQKKKAGTGNCFFCKEGGEMTDCIHCNGTGKVEYVKISKFEEMLKGRIAELEIIKKEFKQDSEPSWMYGGAIDELEQFLGVCQACGGTGEQEQEGPVEDGPRPEPCAECGGSG